VIYAIFDVVIASILLFFLFVARNVTVRDIGLNVSTVNADLLIGAGGFLAAIVPVYAIQFTIREFVEEEPHPVLDLLSKTAGPVEILAAVLTAVVVAPLFEEFIFRMFIQGWLEKAFVTPVPVGQNVDESIDEPIESPPAASIAPAMDIATESDGENPYVSPAPYSAVAPPQVPDRTRPAVVPIVFSSLLFAAAHADTWPSPIPLFPLALILGYVYWRTHRLLPCVVLHALFNGLSVLAVALSQVAQ
jgi:membrane protease YdiL (CAAX protease family)